MQYFRVADNKIISGPVDLPTTWTNPLNGMLYDMTTLTPTELIDLGWYQMVPDTTVIRAGYDTIDSQTYTINGTVVDETIILHPLILSDVIAHKVMIIKEFHDTYLLGTFAWNNHQWYGDDGARQNITGVTSAIVNGLPIPTGFTWNDAANTPVVMTPADLVALGGTMLTWVNTCFQTKLYHIGQISSLTDQNLIITYDHTLGWPT